MRPDASERAAKLIVIARLSWCRLESVPAGSDRLRRVSLNLLEADAGRQSFRVERMSDQTIAVVDRRGIRRTASASEKSNQGNEQCARRPTSHGLDLLFVPGSSGEPAVGAPVCHDCGSKEPRNVIVAGGEGR